LPTTTRYASVLAKIGAEKSSLLGEAKVKGFADNKNLVEFTAQLRDTCYQEQITRITPPVTTRKLERAFYENQIDAYIKILSNSPEKSANYLKMFLVRFEVEHIKMLIKATSVKQSVDQKLSKIYFFAEDYLKHHTIIEEAAKATSETHLIHAFKNTEYWAPLNMGIKNYEESGSTACFDVFIDKFFYEKLYSQFSMLPKKEQKHAFFYANMDNDGYTLLTLLRGKILGLEPNWLRLVVPFNFFSLHKSKVEAIVSAVDFESALKIVNDTSFAKYFVKAQDPNETVANAELAIKREVIAHAKATAIKEIFSIGAPLAFMTQKDAEVHNLVALSLGVDAGMKPDFIRNQLLF
jgi:V/A-type H+/Na+-transporting ATPase subunit C